MLFNSLHFYIFCFIVFPIYFLLQEEKQKKLLLWASVYFYACLKVAFVPLLLLSFIATFLGSIRIFESDSMKTKKLWLYFVLLINLGILIFFKYTDFLRSISHDFQVFIGGNPGEFKAIGFILPLGISFYTFQAIAYAVDVYRGILKPERSFSEFSLFLLFFPQLVAGPIMRADVLIPQFKGRKIFSLENFSIGMGQIALGIFKKTMIADPISDFIEPIFATPSNYDYLSCLLGVYFFTIQIYCDFAGYSDIAIGSGKILGFNIPINFKRPYLASSSTDLWRRWHISLSTWLRDYIYITLGGSRVSILRNYFNVFVTMVIGGIWHGAAWTFVIWGFICGVSLTIEKFFIEFGYEKYFLKIPKLLRISYTFSLFMLGALFFRSLNFELGIQMLKRILTLESSGIFTINWILFIPISILFIIEVLEETEHLSKIKESGFYKLVRVPMLASIFLVAGAIYTVTASPQFYYFQF
ncbi:MAG TPA: MBOAT family O-acyltransferase [Leptospiraceae bacterium]|nr:MBOAT family O-acyltransferase [Leptospiraceae bacterium]HMW07981.1 MBOAT family O-acyltransferase [Leptospiraceae bacterium]HMX34646.1 MBOAT family O-acyltransferase [Leptospiraceae bacterium]HMY34053.1 MBOAT family O-acyltransferase [Leptospiraceae bacterium]HMZ65720.1 MBOAT family O-acyltransferase [Leptospiraceae bacterium]